MSLISLGSVKSAFLRLISISVIVTSLILVGILALSFLGNQVDYKTLDHPLIYEETSDLSRENQFYFKALESVISNYYILRPTSYSLSDLSQATRAIGFASKGSESKQIKMLLLDIYHYNGIWWIISPEDFGAFEPEDKRLSEPETLGLWLSKQKEVGLPTPGLIEFIKNNPQDSISLSLHGSVAQESIEELHEDLKKAGIGEAVILFSDNLNTLRKARKVTPRWLFAVHENQQMKANLMTSIFLESIANLEFDIFVLEKNLESDSNARFRLLREIKRRHKVVLVQSENGEITPHSRIVPYIDGMLISRHAAQKNEAR